MCQANAKYFACKEELKNRGVLSQSSQQVDGRVGSSLADFVAFVV